jgi:uncharacterized DUF497 family protein
MAELRFTWDPAKARTNVNKHGISFEEAETAFSDDNAILVPDPDHSDREERFLLIGLSAALRVLVVVHCEPGPDRTIRIISARRATRSERGQYAARWTS